MSTTKALKWGTAPSILARPHTGSKSGHGSVAPVLDAPDSRPAGLSPGSQVVGIPCGRSCSES